MMKLVQCRVVRPGRDPLASSREFVPLEEFSLWQHLMETRHGLAVVEPQVGLWVPMAEYEADHAANHHHVGVPVTRVSFFAPHRGLETFAQVTRYLLSEEVEELTTILLTHYEDVDGDTPTPVRTPGMCLFRRGMETAAGATSAAARRPLD